MIRLSFEAEFNPPASEEAVNGLESRLGHPLPPAYREMLLAADGFATDELLLYGTGELAERNITFEVGTYVPALFAIGDDGGGQAILLAKDAADSKVYCAGHGALSKTRVVAPSLEAWLANEPTVAQAEDESVGYPLHHPIDVYLERLPPKGLKSLLEVKQVLGIGMGVGELKRAAESGPTRILANVPYGKYKSRCQRIDGASSFLTLCQAGDRSAPLPIDGE